MITHKEIIYSINGPGEMGNFVTFSTCITHAELSQQILEVPAL